MHKRRVRVGGPGPSVGSSRKTSTRASRSRRRFSEPLAMDLSAKNCVLFTPFREYRRVLRISHKSQLMPWHVCCSLRLRSPTEGSPFTVEENNSDRSINVLTLSQAANILKVSRQTMNRMIKKGEIPAVRVGGRWRFLESRFEEWLQER